MLAVDANTLRRLVPRQTDQRGERQSEIIDGIGAGLAATLDDFATNTPLRIAHFLAQIAHESDGFCTTEEYASGRAYENRADLGNTEPGDGMMFKGRGLIQLTGRANYKLVGEMLGLDLVGRPLGVNDPSTYLLVSCAFWRQKGVNRFCDADDIISVTHLVNGGQNGLDSRKAYLARAKALIAPLCAALAEPPGGGVPILHLGCSGDAVTRLQRQLSAAGYPVALDGDFGPATSLAVKHVQAVSGLLADGVVGAQTWAKMQG